MVTTSDLLKKKSQHQGIGMDEGQINQYLAALDGWALQEGKIVKAFGFKDYYQTLAFVNAIVYVIHAEDHHPELVVTYNRCIVKFDTHSVNGGRGGISENDFICASKVDAVYQTSVS